MPEQVGLQEGSLASNAVAIDQDGVNPSKVGRGDVKTLTFLLHNRSFEDGLIDLFLCLARWLCDTCRPTSVSSTTVSHRRLASTFESVRRISRHPTRKANVGSA